MGQLSFSHVLLLTIVLLVFFGPSRLPQLGQSLGKAIKGFKDGLNEIDADSKDVTQNQLNQNQQGMNQNNNQNQNQNQNQNKS